MLDDVSIQGHTIVVLGRFTPSVFSPAWMRLNNLLGQQESEEAAIGFIIPPAANFSTDWLTVNVNEQSLSLSSGVTQDYSRLRDTAIGILTILNQTPINALGLNLECHWQPGSQESWHQFGDDIAPKQFWIELGLFLPGLQDLTIRGVRQDSWGGNLNVTVQPSLPIAGGLYARVNDHYDLRLVERQPSTRTEFLTEEFKPVPVEPASQNVDFALSILRDQWDESISRSEVLIHRLVARSRP
jgi:hypothetical protein